MTTTVPVGNYFVLRAEIGDKEWTTHVHDGAVGVQVLT